LHSRIRKKCITPTPPDNSLREAEQCRSVDLVALQQSVAAAKHAAVKHLVFVSVAHPAPAMKAYVAIRIQCERILQESGLTATIVRPWYVLGPGHYWPYVLLPIYKALEAIPSTRESAIRLGLVTRSQMVNTLASAVASAPVASASPRHPHPHHRRHPLPRNRLIGGMPLTAPNFTCCCERHTIDTCTATVNPHLKCETWGHAAGG
jgi:hypothetical protein